MQRHACRCPQKPTKHAAVPEETEAAPADNPMFSSAFSDVLKQALERQGEDALSSGAKPVTEER